VALRIIRTSGRKLGLALAILVDILNPECIVIGGLGVRLGDMFLGPAREVLASEALQPAVEACRVVPRCLERALATSPRCVSPWMELNTGRRHSRRWSLSTTLLEIALTATVSILL